MLASAPRQFNYHINLLFEAFEVLVSGIHVCVIKYVKRCIPSEIIGWIFMIFLEGLIELGKYCKMLQKVSKR
jgi:hypothetical protein